LPNEHAFSLIYSLTWDSTTGVRAVATFLSAFALLLWSDISTTATHELPVGMSKLNDEGWGHDAQHNYTLEVSESRGFVIMHLLKSGRQSRGSSCKIPLARMQHTSIL
jgi:hypothetical protein